MQALRSAASSSAPLRIQLAAARHSMMEVKFGPDLLKL
jgi:hypothetical protein